MGCEGVDAEASFCNATAVIEPRESWGGLKMEKKVAKIRANVDGSFLLH
jgi:hypothetical protein